MEREGRERILAVAVQAFAAQGYDATTTAQIAREANVTQPLVHHHFGSKEGLWRAAMERVFGDVRETVVLDVSKPPVEALLDVVDRFVRLSSERPEMARIVAREGTTMTPRMEWLLETYLRAPQQGVLALVKAGQNVGVIDPSVSPELLMFFVLGGVGHLFDVGAFARAALGIDPNDEVVRANFVAMVRQLLLRGVLRNPTKSRVR